jgi:acyl-coenzyme A thioesterase 13
MGSKKEEIRKYFESRIDKEPGDDSPPLSKWLGGIIRAVGDGEFTVEYVVRLEMTNPMGILHGGIHSTIIDDMIGMTVYSLGGESYFVSVNLSVDFLGMARAGEKVFARSKIVRKGRQVINGVCELFNEKGVMISRGTSNLVRTNVSS